MNKELTILSPHRSNKSDYCEFGAMALLLALALMQIAFAFNAGSAVVTNHSSIASILQTQDQPMFAKK